MIADLAPNTTATLFAAAKRKDTKQTRAGKDYLCLVLADRTGDVQAIAWDDFDLMNPLFAAGDVIKVEALVGEYQGRPQLTVKRLRKAMPEEVDPADYLPRSEREPEEMLGSLFAQCFAISDDALRAAITALLQEHRNELLIAPAAMQIHHARVGGLLEHILELIAIAEPLCAQYPNLNRDHVIAGCILHDIGKCAELSVGLAFDYSPVGRLLGHVAIGLLWFDAAARMNGVDDETRLRVQHIIVSHHGRKEHGALQVPATPEAILFHYLDELGARMETARQALAEGEGEFTSKVFALDTALYRGAADRGAAA